MKLKVRFIYSKSWTLHVQSLASRQAPVHLPSANIRQISHFNRNQPAAVLGRPGAGANEKPVI